jgi:hypothetical protein
MWDDTPMPFTVEEQMHPVLVDGIQGRACVAKTGTGDPRIIVYLQREHMELGDRFQTKYFKFTRPGQVEWGYEKQTFSIQKIVS